MRRFGGLVIALLVACGELRGAEPPGVDAGSIDTSVGSDAAEPKDARPVEDVTSERPPCPKPCVPEHISNTPDFGALAINQTHLIVAGANAGIFVFEKNGPQTKKLANGKTTRLALSNNQVFWGEDDKLVSCSLDGCAGKPTVLVTGQPGIDEVMAEGNNIVWHTHVGVNDVIRTCPSQTCSNANAAPVTDALNPRAGMGVGDGRVFWADLQSELKHCSLESLPCFSPSKLGPGSNDAVVYGDAVFWVYEQNVVTCPLAGCDNLPKKLGSSPAPHLLALDDHDVYWREMAESKILRCPRKGCTGEPEVLATDVKGVYYGGVVLDADHVYWTAKDGLWRRHK